MLWLSLSTRWFTREQCSSFIAPLQWKGGAITPHRYPPVHGSPHPNLSGTELNLTPNIVSVQVFPVLKPSKGDNFISLKGETRLRTDDIIGLVPAAGKGTRMGWPFAKELWPVLRNNKIAPIALATIENMVMSGVNQIIVVTNSSKPEIMKYFGDGSRFHVNIAYVCQEKFPLVGQSPGLSEAVDCAYHLTRGKTVVFGMPDTIVLPDTCLVELISSIYSGSDITLGLFLTDKPHKYSMVQLNSEGNVEKIIDKPATTSLRYMWGIIAWSPQFTEHVHDVMNTTPTDFASIINLAIQRRLHVNKIIILNGRYFDLSSLDEVPHLSTFVNQHESNECHEEQK